jgi:hypothetical protein
LTSSRGGEAQLARVTLERDVSRDDLEVSRHPATATAENRDTEEWNG